MASKDVRIGLLGCGTVGSAFYELIAARAGEIERRTGLRLSVPAIVVRDVAKPRGPVPSEILTADAASVVEDDEIDVIVETMGGIVPTRELVLAALEAGKPVVSANKELLARHGPEVYDTASASGVDIAFEAAVAAGIPLIRPLRESLVGEDITRVMGILNGTTNFILTQMSENGADYEVALAEAQRLGFAEADPTADVDGLDAGAKAAIIASLAFGRSVTADDVHIEGISSITADDMANAARLGYVIKLLGVVTRHDDGSIGARVHPTMVRVDHPLAAVRDSFNAVFVEGRAVDQIMFYGRGAGGLPTAAMMVGDTIDAALNLLKGTCSTIGAMQPAQMRPIGEVVTAFYVGLDAKDEPGVLAKIAGVFGRRGVSIQSMEQHGLGDEARLVFITHDAVEAQLRATLTELAELEVVKKLGQVLRVIAD